MKPFPVKAFPEHSKWILIVVGMVIFVAAIVIAVTIPLMEKEPLTNNTTNHTNITGNFTPQNSKITNSTSSVTPVSDIENSGVNGVDLSGYRLVDVRKSSDTGNVRCRLCGEWAVQRTIYEYKNSAGETIMIGENYCTSCGRTCKDFWQKGVWSDL